MKGYVFELDEFPGVQFVFEVYNHLNDSKIVAYYTKTPSTWACRVCHKTMKDAWPFDSKFLNSLAVPGSLEMGMSLTHYGLHIGELLLKLGSKQDIQLHVARGEENQFKVKARENVIHDQLLGLLGIRVNEPRAGGAGM